MKRRKTPTAAVALLILATLAFIWGCSVQSKTESLDTSRSVLNVIRPVLELFVGRGNVTDHLVRKLAHFTEFGALGCELALLIILRRRVRAQAIINCLLAGLAAAVVDETIQIFTNRGSQVKDVLLDFSGAAAGILLVLAVYGIFSAIRAGNDRTPR